jgi:cyclopropane fatty-acyl-phospholipid synthase-like methyltransferase
VSALGVHRYADLDFNAPMSSARALELIRGLEPLAGATIVDFGCGWAELLLRALEHEPTARGLGIDRDPALLTRARANADARGLGERVRFESMDVAEWSDDLEVAVVIVIGASQAWGGSQAALDAVRQLLRPGGRLLVGEAFWQQPPTPAALAALDVQADDFLSLAGLVDACVERGFRVLWQSTASLDEWEAFESGYCSGPERWLLAHPNDPAAADMRAEVDGHRRGWLHGYRGILGFAYLTLV